MGDDVGLGAVVVGAGVRERDTTSLTLPLKLRSDLLLTALISVSRSSLAIFSSSASAVGVLRRVGVGLGDAPGRCRMSAIHGWSDGDAAADAA